MPPNSTVLDIIPILGSRWPEASVDVIASDDLRSARSLEMPPYVNRRSSYLLLEARISHHAYSGSLDQRGSRHTIPNMRRPASAQLDDPAIPAAVVISGETVALTRSPTVCGPFSTAPMPISHDKG